MTLLRFLPLAVACCLAAAPALGETLACPDLRAARQVESCPTEEQLRYTYIGFCSDNARMYDGKADACVDFATYRKLKNIALWESADGAFDAYPSCELPPDSIRAAKPARIAVERKGAITQLVCDYGGGVRFTHRTRATCRVEGNGACDGPDGCRATCD